MKKLRHRIICGPNEKHTTLVMAATRACHPMVTCLFTVLGKVDRRKPWISLYQRRGRKPSCRSTYDSRSTRMPSRTSDSYSAELRHVPNVVVLRSGHAAEAPAARK